MAAAPNHKITQHPQRRRQWTASSCGRLIRPVQTALVTLEKTKKQPSLSARAGPVDSAAEHDGANDDDGSICEISKDWAGFNLRGRNRITYTSRKAPSADRPCTNQSSMTPPRIFKQPTLPTPFRDYLRDPVGGNPKRVHVAETPGQPVKTRLPTKLLRQAVFSQKLAEEVVFDALKTLLDSTCGNGPPDAGVPSLLTTSLRGIPGYIQGEVRSRKLVDRDDRSDVAGEVYDWLEDVSQLTGQGEDCLREMVRAQGISIVCDAIRIGLFESHIVRAAAEWCASNSATDACRAMISALIESAQSLQVQARTTRAAGGISYQTSPAFNLIADATRASSRNTSSTSHFRTLLISQTIPIFALSSKEATNYRAMAVSTILLRGRYASNALDLLETMLLTCCGVDPLSLSQHDLEDHHSNGTRFLQEQQSARDPAHERLQHELIRGLHAYIVETCAILVSTAYIGHRARGRIDEQGMAYNEPIRALRGAALGIMRTFTSAALLERALRCGLGPVICTVLMSDLIVALDDLEPFDRRGPRKALIQQRLTFITRLCTAWRSGDGAPKVSTNSLSNLIRDIVVTCEEHCQGNGFELVQSLTRQLIAHEGVSSLRAIACKQIALDAALSFAQSTKAREHVAFAQKLEKSISLGRPAGERPETPRPGKSCLLRWEEGLCEWVEATPKAVPESSLSSLVAQEGEDEEKENLDAWDELALVSPAKGSRCRSGAALMLTEPKPASSVKAPTREGKGTGKARNASKRHFSDFLVNDEDYEDELSVEPAVPLKDVTNTKPAKLRKTL